VLEAGPQLNPLPILIGSGRAAGLGLVSRLVRFEGSEEAVDTCNEAIIDFVRT
jgi:hypothetical protein